MLNQTIIVGRLVKDPELDMTDNGKKVSRITLAVPRSYKNVNGIYETDYIDCTLWTGIAETANTYCKKGDLIGVRGRIQTSVIEKEDGKKKKTEVVAEKVTFLSPKKNETEDEQLDITNDNKKSKK